MGTVYKVVEIGTVTDEEIERVLNEWAARGWRYDGLQFAMRDSSRRPAMAFVTFTREGAEAGEGRGPGRDGEDAEGV